MYIMTRLKGSALLAHANANDTRYPFAKLVMYPMYREERMLPREAMVISGESPSQLTLRIENPTGETYNFHGAMFSFSLNLVYA